jgi:hypothetical protein
MKVNFREIFINVSAACLAFGTMGIAIVYGFMTAK